MSDKLAAERVVSDFEKSRESEGWMVALFRQEGDKIFLERTTHKFKIVNFDKAIGLFADSLAKERHRLVDAKEIPADPIPLMIASEFDEGAPPEDDEIEEQAQDNDGNVVVPNSPEQIEAARLNILREE